MKKVLFLIILLLPFMVEAKLNEVELKTQVNTYMSSNIGSNTIFQTGEYFMISGVNITANSFSVGYSLYDINGQVKSSYTEEQKAWISHIISDEETTYLASYESTSSTSSMLVKVENLTGTKKAELEVPYKVSSIFLNDKGLVASDSTNYILISEDFTTYQVVDETYAYNTEIERTDKLSTEQFAKIQNYIIEKKNITSNDFAINYAIECNNQYYTIIKEADNKFSLVYTNKDLTEISSKAIINDSFEEPTDDEATGNSIIDIFSYEDKIVIFINYELEGIPKAPLDYVLYGKNIIMQTYNHLYNIDVQSDENGTVTATKLSSLAGEEIEFTVTPKKGYELSYIEVTDSNNKTVVFKDYKFTMPSSDVTIKAVFVPTNPETADFALYTGILFLIVVLIFNVTSYKKLKYLN